MKIDLLHLQRPVFGQGRDAIVFQMEFAQLIHEMETIRQAVEVACREVQPIVTMGYRIENFFASPLSIFALYRVAGLIDPVGERAVDRLRLFT